MKKATIATILSLIMILSGCSSSGVSDSAASSDSVDKTSALTITNVSYDPTRELYADYNDFFTSNYNQKSQQQVEVVQSHGGSGAQARSVIEGANADVVTLALAHDITLIEEAGLIEPGWEKEFEHNSAPYTSTIVFLVRKGNEKGIKDWDSLLNKDIRIITPDPKSSGGACWNFLAAWHYADLKYNGDKSRIMDFVKNIYQNVLVMDSGARGATTTFVENGQGDVLIAWENEALLTVDEYPGEYELVTPSVSILAEPSVAIVDENAAKNNTADLAKEYLSGLYEKEAQRIAAQHYYRPINEDILKEFSGTFDLNMTLCTIDDFGGWNKAYEDFFKDDAIFDQIYQDLS